jgi:putrescine importer
MERNVVMKDLIQKNKFLSNAQLVSLGIAWTSPMVVFTNYGLGYLSSDGMLATAYVFACIAICFTAYSYAQMVRAYPQSGSAYTYVGKSFHPVAGFLVGWALLLDYLFTPMICCLVFGLYLNAEFPSISLEIWVLLSAVLITVCNLLGIRISANISRLSVLIQLVFIVAFCALCIRYALGDGVSLVSTAPFLNPDSTLMAGIAGASLLCFCFLGFDSVTILSEDTRTPKVSIPKAMAIIIAIVSVSYLAVSYFGILTHAGTTFDNPDSASLDVIHNIGGALFGAVFITVYAICCLTGGIASLASISKLLFAMGRESTLPKPFFGYIHPRLKTPVPNILLTGAVSLLSLVISLESAINFISFGALTAFFFVNFSVIRHYYVKRQHRSAKDILRYLILPLCGMFCIGWLFSHLSVNAFLLGGSWLAVGITYLIFITRGFRSLPPSLKIEEAA